MRFVPHRILQAFLPPSWIREKHYERITIDPQLCGGRPCIRHMRIRVKDILDLLASGASTAEILEDYPYLEADDIKAALEYAAHQMDHPILSVA
jgi:uncharacterized protein (DUF433 family)